MKYAYIVARFSINNNAITAGKYKMYPMIYTMSA